MFKMAKTASHFVDPQKGFTPLCPDELPVPDGHNIVKELNKQMAYSLTQTCSKDAHNRTAIWVENDKQKQFDPVTGKHVDICWKAHCIVGETGFELLDGLPPVDSFDYFVWKGIELDMHPYGSCYHDQNDTISTGLIEFYKSLNIKHVIVGGLATDYCVLLTCKQLKNFFDVSLNLQGCRGLVPSTTDIAIEEMKDLGINIVEKVKDFSKIVEA